MKPSCVWSSARNRATSQLRVNLKSVRVCDDTDYNSIKLELTDTDAEGTVEVAVRSTAELVRGRRDAAVGCA